MNIFKTARKAAGLTQEDLAERAGVSRITVNRLEQRGMCTRKQAELFAPILGLSVEALMLGGPVAGNHDEPVSSVNELPVVGEVAAGIWLEADFFDEPRFEPVAAVIDPAFPPDCQFGLIVRGPSIDRTAADGATLICVSTDTGVEIKDGDLVIVERIRDQGSIVETTAKFIRRTSSGYELWPHSSDPRYQSPIKVEGEDTDQDISVSIRAKVLAISSAPKAPWDD